MHGNHDEHLSNLNENLKNAEREKAESYLESDIHRVWEITHHVIPQLEREISALTGSGSAPEPAAPPDLIDFSRIDIKIVEAQRSRFGWLSARRRPVCVQVELSFTAEQISIAQTLLQHVVFYQSQGSSQVRVADLLSGFWTSDRSSTEDAETTSENARQGIADLRLIIQARAAANGG